MNYAILGCLEIVILAWFSPYRRLNQDLNIKWSPNVIFLFFSLVLHTSNLLRQSKRVVQSLPRLWYILSLPPVLPPFSLCNDPTSAWMLLKDVSRTSLESTNIFIFYCWYSMSDELFTLAGIVGLSLTTPTMLLIVCLVSSYFFKLILV